MRLMHYGSGAAKIALLIAAFKFIEALIAPPPVVDAPRWLVAAVVSFNFWAAGAALGAIAVLGWASQRLFGWPAPEPPSAIRPARHVVPTAEMRLRGLGFNVVAGWVVLGSLALILMADTGTGLFAQLAVHLFGPNGWAGLETFLLGLPVLAAPLLLLAWLPWQTRFPLLASMQAAVKPPAKAPARRRKRP
jgi:hypothetical protein